MICHLGYIKQFDCPSIRYKQKTLKIHTYNIYYIYMHNIVIPIWDQFLKEQKHTFFFLWKATQITMLFTEWFPVTCAIL